jgi:hypothetical protein
MAKEPFRPQIFSYILGTEKLGLERLGPERRAIVLMLSLEFNDEFKAGYIFFSLMILTQYVVLFRIFLNTGVSTHISRGR